MNLFPDSENQGELHCPHCGQLRKEPIRLQEGIGYDGVLQDLKDSSDGLIIVNISDYIIELPCVLKSKLEPLLGQAVRVALLFGKYHAAKMTRRA